LNFVKQQNNLKKIIIMKIEFNEFELHYIKIAVRFSDVICYLTKKSLSKNPIEDRKKLLEKLEKLDKK
jgi:hypothetical protein